jgi:hypothetical protein
MARGSISRQNGTCLLQLCKPDEDKERMRKYSIREIWEGFTVALRVSFIMVGSLCISQFFVIAPLLAYIRYGSFVFPILAITWMAIKFTVVITLIFAVILTAYGIWGPAED